MDHLPDNDLENITRNEIYRIFLKQKIGHFFGALFFISGISVATFNEPAGFCGRIHGLIEILTSIFPCHGPLMLGKIEFDFQFRQSLKVFLIQIKVGIGCREYFISLWNTACVGCESGSFFRHIGCNGTG